MAQIPSIILIIIASFGGNWIYFSFHQKCYIILYKFKLKLLEFLQRVFFLYINHFYFIFIDKRHQIFYYERNNKKC